MDKVYLRSSDGNTYTAPFQKGLSDFLSEGGSRITLHLPDGVEMTIWRDPSVPTTTTPLTSERAIENCHIRVRTAEPDVAPVDEGDNDPIPSPPTREDFVAWQDVHDARRALWDSYPDGVGEP